MAGEDGETSKKKNPAPLPPPLIAIGWREHAGLPDLGVEIITAKMDTGAKLSAIHACNIEEVEIKGVRVVLFRLHPVQRKNTPEIICRAPVKGRRTIKSSNGLTEKRYVIETRLQLGQKIWKIELTLTNREAMDYRLLLGRDALRKKFTIDPNASYLLGSSQNK